MKPHCPLRSGHHCERSLLTRRSIFDHDPNTIRLRMFGQAHSNTQHQAGTQQATHRRQARHVQARDPPNRPHYPPNRRSSNLGNGRHWQTHRYAQCNAGKRTRCARHCNHAWPWQQPGHSQAPMAPHPAQPNYALCRNGGKAPAPDRYHLLGTNWPPTKQPTNANQPPVISGPCQSTKAKISPQRRRSIVLLAIFQNDIKEDGH